MSQDIQEFAARIARDVVESGRVIQEDGQLNAESLRNEVEFECLEQKLPDCDQIADAAVQMLRQ